jgi:hypothetical protein
MAAPITKERATPEEVERRILFIQNVMVMRRWRTADEIECAKEWGVSRAAVRKYSNKASRRVIAEYKKDYPNDEDLRTALIIKALHTSDMALIEGNPTTVTTEKITRDPNGDPIVTRSTAVHKNRDYRARLQGIELAATLAGVSKPAQATVKIEGTSAAELGAIAMDLVKKTFRKGVAPSEDETPAAGDPSEGEPVDDSAPEESAPT